MNPSMFFPTTLPIKLPCMHAGDGAEALSSWPDGLHSASPGPKRHSVWDTEGAQRMLAKSTFEGHIKMRSHANMDVQEQDCHHCSM